VTKLLSNITVLWLSRRAAQQPECDKNRWILILKQYNIYLWPWHNRTEQAYTCWNKRVYPNLNLMPVINFSLTVSDNVTKILYEPLLCFTSIPYENHCSDHFYIKWGHPLFSSIHQYVIKNRHKLISKHRPSIFNHFQLCKYQAVLCAPLMTRFATDAWMLQCHSTDYHSLLTDYET